MSCRQQNLFSYFIADQSQTECNIHFNIQVVIELSSIYSGLLLSLQLSRPTPPPPHLYPFMLLFCFQETFPFYPLIIKNLSCAHGRHCMHIYDKHPIHTLSIFIKLIQCWQSLSLCLKNGNSPVDNRGHHYWVILIQTVQKNKSPGGLNAHLNWRKLPFGAHRGMLSIRKAMEALPLVTFYIGPPPQPATPRRGHWDHPGNCHEQSLFFT